MVWPIPQDRCASLPRPGASRRCWAARPCKPGCGRAFVSWDTQAKPEEKGVRDQGTQSSSSAVVAPSPSTWPSLCMASFTRLVGWSVNFLRLETGLTWKRPVDFFQKPPAIMLPLPLLWLDGPGQIPSSLQVCVVCLPCLSFEFWEMWSLMANCLMCVVRECECFCPGAGEQCADGCGCFLRSWAVLSI